jgi:hypothetical protein
MRYILIGIILLSFIGCGSSNTTKSKESNNTTNPSSPIPKDSTKQPPSIPKLL